MAIRAVSQKYPKRFAAGSALLTAGLLVALGALVWEPPADEVQQTPLLSETAVFEEVEVEDDHDDTIDLDLAFVGPVAPPEILEERAMAALRQEVAAAETAAARVRAAGKLAAAKGRNAFVAPADLANPHDFIWPVPSTYITSRFGERKDPLDPEVARVHRGVDVRCPSGTPVRASGDGEVVVARRSSRGGVSVRVRHANNISTLYAHLGSASVKVGDRVKGGQIIGRSGATGRVTGPHLHFEFWRGKQVIDPQKLSWREPPIRDSEDESMTASLDEPVGPAKAAGVLARR